MRLALGNCLGALEDAREALKFAPKYHEVSQNLIYNYQSGYVLSDSNYFISINKKSLGTTYVAFESGKSEKYDFLFILNTFCTLKTLNFSYINK